MAVLDPVPDQYPDPDCAHCGGEGIPQSLGHMILGDEWSNKPCHHCYENEDRTDD